MAEVVQRNLEEMVPHLVFYLQNGLFKRHEIRSIIQRRRDFEYALKRRVGRKADYFRYLEYEINLNKLLQKRLEKKKNLHDPKVFGIQRGIISIFEKALMRFADDKKIWIQYIHFLKSENMEVVLGKVISRAIQIHPLESGFWIMAASWEYEFNANADGARVLFQRGIRMNGENQEIWFQYFRLELYLIDALVHQKNHISTIVESVTEKIMQAKSNQNQMLIPSLQGEKAFEPMNVNEKMNAFYDFAVPKVIYKNAIKAIPNSLSFRLRFLEEYRKYTNTQSGRDEIYESIERDFGNDVKAQEILCSRFLWDHVNQLTEARIVFANADVALNLFYEAVKRIQTGEMWQAIARFLHECITFFKAKKIRIFFQERLYEVHEKALAAKQATENMLIEWIQQAHFRFKQTLEKADLELLIKLVSMAAKRFPKSESFRISQLKLHNSKLSGKAAIEQRKHLFKQMLDCVPDSEIIWMAYFDWVITTINSIDEDLIKLVENLIYECLAKLRGNKKGQGEILNIFLLWTLHSQGFDRARAAYQDIMKKGLSQEIYPKALEIECLKGAPSIEKLREIYESWLSSQPQNMDVWLEFIKIEQDHGEFDKATDLYWRATKILSDPDLFITKYNALK